MTPRQIELIENSWDSILHNGDAAGVIFYGKLFELAPEIRKLFKEDMKSQGQKLITMITLLVHKLDNLQEVSDDIEALGVRHRNYGVKPQYYPTVGTALIWTLESLLGSQWNEELEQAWTQMYIELSSKMIKA